MCSKPRIPKAPKVTQTTAPPPPEKTATQVGASSEAQNRTQIGSTTLGSFNLQLPPSFRIPTGR